MSKKNLPKNDEKVIRSFSMPDIRTVPIDDIGAGGIVEGHAAVYDQTTNIGGWFNEVIERGAFDECDFTDVLFTANHNMWDIPLARSRRNNSNSTLQLSLDNVGLFMRANLDIENNSEAKNLYSAINRSDIEGMSFIFYVKDAEWQDLDSDMPTRRIKKVAKVTEVSAVNFPAYEGTDINARDQDALENARKALENARSTLENDKNEREALKLKNKILGGV